MGMDVLQDAPAFIDNGTAPEFFANGLHEVEVMGPVCRFILYALRRTANGQIKEPVFTCIMPVEAVGPAIQLTIRRLASGLVVPTMNNAMRSLLRLH